MVKNETIVKELKKISQQNNGILLPETVVSLASDKKHPLHDCFTWDNNKAAYEYRLWEARMLIRVSVEYSEVTKKEYDVFVSLSSDRNHGGGYREVESVLDDENLRRILLNDALNEMNIFIEKYNQLKELSEVFEVMIHTSKKYAKPKKSRVEDYTILPKVSPI